jgi:hypothetical protein
VGFIPGFTPSSPSPRTEGAFPSQLGGPKETEDGPRQLISTQSKAQVHLCA